MVNVGSFDRLLRAVAGVALLSLPFIPAFAAALAGLGSWIWGFPVVGFALLGSAALQFCPAYALLGIRTCASRGEA